MIVSAVTGLQDPKDVNFDLLSPPLKNFYTSLSNRTKERLNIPLKTNQAPRDIKLKGIVNPNLNLNDEKPPRFEEVLDKTENRKISIVVQNPTRF